MILNRTGTVCRDCGYLTPLPPKKHFLKPWKDPESLFCDTGFLNVFFQEFGVNPKITNLKVSNNPYDFLKKIPWRGVEVRYQRKGRSHKWKETCAFFDRIPFRSLPLDIFWKKKRSESYKLCYNIYKLLKTHKKPIFQKDVWKRFDTDRRAVSRAIVFLEEEGIIKREEISLDGCFTYKLILLR